MSILFLRTKQTPNIVLIKLKRVITIAMNKSSMIPGTTYWHIGYFTFWYRPKNIAITINIKSITAIKVILDFIKILLLLRVEIRVNLA